MKKTLPNGLATGCSKSKMLIVVTLFVTLAATGSFVPVLGQSSQPSFSSKWVVEDRLAWVRVSVDGTETDFHVTVNVARTTTFVDGELRTYVKMTLERVEPLSLSYVQLRIPFPEGSYIEIVWIDGPSIQPGRIRTVHIHVAPGIAQKFPAIFVALLGVAALIVGPPSDRILLWVAGVVDQVIGAAKEDRNSDGSWDIWVPIDSDQLVRILHEWILIATSTWWRKVTSTGREPLERTNTRPPPTPRPLVYTAYIKTVTRTHVRYNVVSWNIVNGSIPRTYTVTLSYVGGASETFHWVISFKLEPPPLVPITLPT